MVAVITDYSAEVEKLRRAVKWSLKKLAPVVANRDAFVAAYIGNRANDDGTRTMTPVNDLNLAINIDRRTLVSKNPRVLVTSPKPELKYRCFIEELNVNKLLEEIDFVNTLSRLVLDAEFAMGIAKVGINTSSEEVLGYLHDPGQEFCDRIDLSDWVHDCSVPVTEQCAYMGNRYRIPLEQARNDERSDKNVRESLEASKRLYGAQGEDADECELDEMVDLWDIWFPRKRKFCTIPSNDEGLPFGKELMVTEWEGSESGPYHILQLGDIPNSTLPLAPAMNLIQMHEFGNSMYQRISEDTNADKTVYLARAAAMEDAKRMPYARNFEIIPSDDPGGVNAFKTGGANPQTLLMYLENSKQFSRHAGNLDIRGGLGPQSSTYGQDRMLAATSSVQTEDSQNRVYLFTQKIVTDLARYVYEDPTRERHMKHRISGTKMDVNYHYKPEDRKGPFDDYDWRIEPYSMQYRSPTERLQNIMSFIQQIGIPLAPLAMQEGGQMSFKKILELFARYQDESELYDLWTFSSGSPKGELIQPSGKPAQTKRTYERVNRPGATRAGSDGALMQAMLTGGGMQQSELAAIGRPNT